MNFCKPGINWFEFSPLRFTIGAAGLDVTLETADVALMGDKLETLPFAIGLSRKAKGIIKQNLWINLGIVAILIPFTIIGLANIVLAVLIYEGSTLFCGFCGQDFSMWIVSWIKCR